MTNGQAARLFNPWAAFFGPLYYLCTGLWRKSLVGYLLFFLGSWFLPSAPEELALENILRDHYAMGLLTLVAQLADLRNVAVSSFGLTLATTLPVVLLDLGVFFLLAGRKGTGGCCLVLLGALIVVQERFIAGLHLGIAPALLWLLSRDLWPLMIAVVWYALLTARLPVLWLSAGVATGLAWYGVPVTAPDVQSVFLACLSTTFGAMAVLDTYRKNVFLQRFWW